MNWDSCPNSLTEINLSKNELSEINWVGCPPGLTTIGLSYNKITQMNWDSCRNEFITRLANPYFSDYLIHKQSKNFIPYLPIVSKEKKELHYSLSHIWWSCPNGIRYLEDVQELKEEFGMFR
jgi:Leucine-rich repeat (LRR) protein